ncbi:MAG: RNB domain-containing ribonuclease [Parachlamydiaceae bacterium]|nr:RNB domain-containing ribonuclease [Parachlamydiaceae bacterium]
MNQPTSTSSILKVLAKKALLEHGFLPEYNVSVQNEVAQLQLPKLSPTDSIKDYRNKLWFSIDNDDSKDLDQLTYAEALNDNTYKIYIAVANVDLLVKKNSPIDLFAQHNTTSIYCPTINFPMLPTNLSYDLTSLNEHQDREAMIIEIIINSDGTIGQYDTYLALVNNKAKFAYNSLAPWLETSNNPPIKIAQVPGISDQIILQDKIAKLMRKNRKFQGALTLVTIEATPLLSDDKIVDLVPAESNRAHNLIEDFMIAANIAVARFLGNHQVPSLQRVVRIPKRWDRIVEIASTYGFQLPKDPDPIKLDQFLQERNKADPLNFPTLSLTVIKLLGNGEYVVKYPGIAPLGHFDLALKDYTHSTAPNRRYTDLITQRLLKSILSNQPQPYLPQELESLAKHCTEKESDANKVERKMKKAAAILILTPKLNQNFDALVTGASDKGTWVRIFHPVVEGKLVKGYQGVDVGDQIIVKLVHLDLENGFIDFEYVADNVKHIPASS